MLVSAPRVMALVAEAAMEDEGEVAEGAMAEDVMVGEEEEVANVTSVTGTGTLHVNVRPMGVVTAVVEVEEVGVVTEVEEEEDVAASSAAKKVTCLGSALREEVEVAAAEVVAEAVTTAARKVTFLGTVTTISNKSLLPMMTFELFIPPASSILLFLLIKCSIYDLFEFCLQVGFTVFRLVIS